MVYIPQQQILTRLRRYKALNKTRLQRALSLMPAEARFCLSIVPVLLHYNHINLPGFRNGYIPQGIDLFTPNEQQRRYVNSLLLPDSPPLQEPQEHDILGLYAMGSTSSLGQSDSSDVDIWVCVRSHISPDGMRALQNKCRFITNYVKARGVELNLFVTPEDRFTNFTPDSLDEENCGSAQNLFLLDEFYRSSIRLCGRYIIWYLISTKEEQSDYDSYVNFLLKGISGLPYEHLRQGHVHNDYEHSSIAPHIESISLKSQNNAISPAFAAADAIVHNHNQSTPPHKESSRSADLSTKVKESQDFTPISSVDHVSLLQSSTFSRTNAMAESSLIQGSLCSQLSPLDYEPLASSSHSPYGHEQSLANDKFYAATATATASSAGAAVAAGAAGTAPGAQLNWEDASHQCPMLALACYTIRCLESLENQSPQGQFVEGKVDLRELRQHSSALLSSTLQALATGSALNVETTAPAPAPEVKAPDESEMALELSESVSLKSETEEIVGAAGDKKSSKHLLQSARALLKNSSFSQYFPYLLNSSNDETAPKSKKLDQVELAYPGDTSHGIAMTFTDPKHLPETTMVLPAKHLKHRQDAALEQGRASFAVEPLEAAVRAGKKVLSSQVLLPSHISSSTWEWWDKGELSPEHYGDDDESYFARHIEEREGHTTTPPLEQHLQGQDKVLSSLGSASGSSKKDKSSEETESGDYFPEWANGNVLTLEESIASALHDGWEEFSAPLKEDEWFDFGSVVKSSPTEYFGSGLWLLYKAIDSPFKVVLKILLMEAYSSDYPQTKLLSSELKEYMHSHDGYSLDLDSYYLMYLKVSNYLQQLQSQSKGKAKLKAATASVAAATADGADTEGALEEEEGFDRLTLMRKCFYLKIFKGLSHKNANYTEDYLLKRELLNKFIQRWGWSSSFVKELESIKSWKMQAVSDFNREVYNTLLESYLALLRFSVRHGIEYAITSDDAGVLSRKLYAAFDRYPGKIPVMHASMRHDLEERHLTFIHPSEYSLCRHGWHLYAAAPNDVSLLNTKVSYIGARLSEVVTWACFNGLMTSRSFTHVVGAAPHEISRNIKQLSRDIQRVLGPCLGSASEQALQEAQKLQSCVVVLNLEQDDTELLQDNLVDIDYGSTLCWGRQRVCLVGSIDLVFINSWGEIRSVSFPSGEEGVVELLATLLRIMSNSSDEHESAIALLNKVEVCSYASSYQDLLKYDLEAIIRQVFNCLNEGNSSEFVFEVGRNTYIARARGERGVVIQRNGVFGSNEFDISVLSRYGMRPEFALQVPPIVDRYASAGIVQYFFAPLQHGHWDIYILNERNEVRIYHDYYGSRASLVNAINRFYTSQSQSRALYAFHFNLPQYFVLSNDQKSLHPFTIKNVEP